MTTEKQEEDQEQWRQDGLDDSQSCPYCRGRGSLTVDSGGAGPAYACPDCEGEE